MVYLGSLSAIEVPSTVKEKYRYLYNEVVSVEPDGSKRFHQGRLFHREGINVLYLNGDRFEMGFQHGRLLRKESQDGALAMAPRLVPNIIDNTYSGRPLMRAIAKKYVDSFVTGKLTNHLMGMGGDAQLADAYGVSEGAGIPLDDVIQGLLNPDVLMILAARSLDERSGTVHSPNQCSDFAVWGKHSKGGELIIGRNMDFGLNGYYDKYPTVIYFDPTEADAQRYLTIISAGVHNAGFQSLNESGIFVGVHTIPTSETNMEGVPAFILAAEVIRNAETFDEAVSLFRKYHVPSGYTYTLVSTKERKVGAVELSGNTTTLRLSSDDHHAQTNHFISPEMVDKNLYINHSVDEDSYARLRRIEQMIVENGPLEGSKDAMAILADKVDAFSSNAEPKSLGNTVAVHTTITSAVLLPDQGRMYVASGMAPTSQSTFVEFPLIENFSVDGFASAPFEVIDNSEFKSQYPEKAMAEQQFIRAKMAYEYDNNIAAASQYLQEVVRLEPNNAHYRFVLGVFLLKRGYFADALASFRSMLTSHPSRHQQQLAHYYMGRIYSHWRYTADALEDFETILSAAEADPKLLEAALQAHQKTKKWGGMRLKLNHLPIMMQQADMQYY